MAGNVALNFWQDTGFGTGKAYQSSGWVGVFTGWYFPIDLSQGKSVGFLWPYTDHYIYSASSFSAQVNNSNRDDATVSISFAGDFIPLLRESGVFGVNLISGQPVADNVDRPVWRLSMSGMTTGDSIDKPNFYSRFSSGSVSRVDTVSGKCYLSFSGAVTTPNNDSGRFGVSFYGSFTQPDSTGMAISMALSAITYGDANTYSTMSWTNTGQIAFRISTIIYANAS